MGETLAVLKEIRDELRDLKGIVLEQEKYLNPKKLTPHPPKHPKGFCGDVDCYCNYKKPVYMWSENPTIYKTDGTGR